MSDRLSFWVGGSPTKAWDRIIIAAYTVADAINLYVEAGGAERGATNQIRDYFSRMDDVPHFARKVVFNPARGVYFVDQMGSSVMFHAPIARSVVDPIPPEAVAAATGQPIPPQYGRLFVGFDRGIKVDTWKFRSAHGDRAFADQLTCEVRLQPRERGGAGFQAGEEGGMEFFATSKIWEGKVRATDINTLFAAVAEQFRTFELAQRGIVWEDWLEVKTTPEDVYQTDRSNGLAVGYRVLKRGVYPLSGRAYTLLENGSGSVVPFPQPKAAGVQLERDEHRHDTGSQYAYIPKTPEAVAALDAIIGKIAELRNRLNDLLHQDAIALELPGALATLRLPDRST